MGNLKKLTILHSNDMHGDFFAEKANEGLLGGVSMLSGYINKVRGEEENVLYTVSGDMFRGSLIDSEYKGLSTIEIMNLLAPDVVSLGNHEVDYGIAHLLFLEKCANFPIINANMYLVPNGTRLFSGHFIKKIGGIKVMFIGVLTKEVLAYARREKLVGSFVDVYEASQEIGKLCDAYQTEDIDLTVLLTHIGFEEDKRLAELLNPDWGIDIIIGGHSHTLLSQPAVVNGIPIVQAATGTDQIGRFDITVDADKNCLDSYTWQLVPINSDHCPRDKGLETVIRRYHNATDAKYGRHLTCFDRELTHPRRDRETELGRTFADILKEQTELDLILLASGSLRKESMGPAVDYQDLIETYPYGDSIHRIVLDGAQLKCVIRHIFRSDAFEGLHTEFYQFSKGIRFEVSLKNRAVDNITFNGEPIPDDKLFRVGMQKFHFKNAESFVGLNEAELNKHKPPSIVAANEINVVEEYMCRHKKITCPTDKRWITVE